ncbi:hypothetical protein SDC9_118811 [bioreactor metagenome]|uniref:Uncharacterized protein n=1 Tax=bioreactor metagenome TaxID=1076179 RepID=A0A645C242_9ZZZZ
MGADTFLIAGQSVRVQPEFAARAAQSGIVEIGRLKDNGAGVRLNARLQTAHDTGDADRLRRIAYHESLRRNCPLLMVEGREGHALSCLPHHDMAFAALRRDFADIEGVHGLAVFHHDIVCDVDDVVDGAHAAGPDPLPQPFGRGADFDIGDGPCRIAGAENGSLHSDIHKLIDFPSAALDGGNMPFERLVEGGRHFAGDADDRLNIRAVGGDFNVIYHIIEAQDLLDVLADLAGLLYEENAVFNAVGEI